MNDTSRQILSTNKSISTPIAKFCRLTSRFCKILSIKTLFNLVLFPDFPEILGFLHHSYQRLQLLRSKSLELFHNVSIIIQLQESRVELHLLGKREGIDIAVGDISVYRVTHTLGYIVMRNSCVSKVCRKGVSAPCATWLDLPSHTLDKTADTFLYVLILHRNTLPPVYRSHGIAIYARKHQGSLYRRGSNLIKNSLQWRNDWNYNLIVTSVLRLLADELE